MNGTHPRSALPGFVPTLGITLIWVSLIVYTADSVVRRRRAMA